MTLLTLENIHKTYANGTIALKGVDLAIQPQEFISLVGPSGCGKSTLLRLVADLGKPSSGQLHWHLPTAERKMAFVFQDAALMPWANIVENVHLPLKLQGQSLRKARADIQEALNLVNLQGFEQSYPRQLSGGMKMRVSIARALVTKPNLVLLDEPFGALDEITRSRLNNDLLQLWAQKHWTTLFVTHNLYEAVYLSSRVVVMAAHPGRVIADIPITTPYPRTEEFRMSTEFNDYCQKIWQHLTPTAKIQNPKSKI